MAKNGAIAQTTFTDYNSIQNNTKDLTVKAVHITELRRAIEALQTSVVNVDNCGNCSETCQSCQACQQKVYKCQAESSYNDTTYISQCSTQCDLSSNCGGSYVCDPCQ